MSVWLRAAEIVSDDYGRWGCCAAIDLSGAFQNEIAQFTSIFRPFGMGAGEFWWPNPFCGSQADQTARILALLLMAELEKDGQL